MTQLNPIDEDSEASFNWRITDQRYSRALETYENCKVIRSCVRAYVLQLIRIWNQLPASIRATPQGRKFGRHLHRLVCLVAERKQYVATFFLRNRPELEAICSLLDQKPHGSSVNLLVLACSKGAEVYSIAWAIRCARPDLRLQIYAVDIAEEIVEYAKLGIYSRKSLDALAALNDASNSGEHDVNWNSLRDQGAPMFERMTDNEIEEMFDLEGDQASVKPWLREGIAWLSGDAADPKLAELLGPQDIVVANRFLCHMNPAAAEECLCNIARFVRPGGQLFVSGIDLDVRTKVARMLGWVPVIDRMREIHEGDTSLLRGWPLAYWGLEPFCDDRPDWKIRYASRFQISTKP